MRKHKAQDLSFLCLLLMGLSNSASSAAPHIIFIVADDLGWNDVSFHGSDQIPTPNLDALAYNGIILNSHYVQPLCTPSRAALMTGKYPIHTGMQGLPMYGSEPRGLPAGKILPQYLKDLGYATHAVGKWHLGFYKEEFTPVKRGFDDHLGFWGGATSYYDHILQDVYPDGTTFSGHDFRRNMETAWDLDGQYATDIFANEAVDIINKHPTNKPLFLYVAHLAVHTGNTGKWLEAPQDEINKFKYIPDPNRRTYAAMISKLDESVGKLVQSLQRRNMLENSIIVFIADNGAPTIGIFQNWGSNYPLRGIKATLWEGGIRGASLIWSPLIKSPHRVSNELVHISDWLPTLYRAAGGNMTNLPQDLDGKDQWDAFANNGTSPRKNILLNIDEVLKNAAIRDGDWKLVIGSYGINGSFDGYSGESGSESNNPVYDASKVMNSPTWQSLKTLSRTLNVATENQINDLRKTATVRCGEQHNNSATNCNPSVTKQPCLFNIALDPCETTNVARRYDNIAKKLYYSLASVKRTITPQLNKPLDLIGADPEKHNNTWVPWLSM